MGKLSRQKRAQRRAENPPDPNQMIEVQHRICRQCPPGDGCNTGLRKFNVPRSLFKMTEEFFDGYPLPIGTHIKLVSARAADLTWVQNHNTQMEYQDGDVLELLEPHSIRHAADVGDGFKLYGNIGVAWVPTLEPVTKATAEEIQYRNDWRAAIEEDNERNERKRREEEERLYALQHEAAAIYIKHADSAAAVADFINSESFMRAQVGAEFLRRSGACDPPQRYVNAFPKEMPVAKIWHDYICQNKPAPSGQPVEFYWVSRLVSRVPNLMKETLRKIKGHMGEAAYRKMLRADWVPYEDAEYHFSNPEFRALFAKFLPWPYLEYRLRESRELDKTKNHINIDNIYMVTEWEVGLGKVTYPAVEEEVQKPAEQPVQEKSSFDLGLIVNETDAVAA